MSLSVPFNLKQPFIDNSHNERLMLFKNLETNEQEQPQNAIKIKSS